MEKVIKEKKLARGILIHNYSVLLVQDVRPGEGHFFLPGGHIEPGESATKALPREWEEELGWSIEIGSFLGCLESKWGYKRNQDGVFVEVFEVNFLFLVPAPADMPLGKPVSREPHLSFSWVPIAELSSINLLPEPLKEIIPKVATSQPSAIWASTLD